MEKLSIEEFRGLMKKHENLLIVNVLPEEEYKQGHIPGSLNFPALDKDFVKRVKAEANGNDTPIAVYCSDEHCGLSGTAARRLESADFENVYEYPGGTKAWADEGLELEGLGPDGPEAPGQTEYEEKQRAKPGKEDDMEPSKRKTKPKTKAAKTKQEKPSDEETQSDEEHEESTSAKTEGNEKATSTEKRKRSSKAIEREASAQWKGTIKDGHGAMQIGASGAIELPYSFSSRFESADMTNPEELIGAAHAGCFSMALAKVLEDEGYTPRSLETKATVALERENGAFRIASIHLEVTGEVDDINDGEFEALAQKAGENCPVSKALADPEITVTATLGA